MIIYALKLNLNKTLDASARLLNVLGANERDRFNRYKNQLAAQQFLSGRILLRYILCKHHNLSNGQITIGYNRFGKPLLIDSELQFNIAHSKAWLVCVVANNPVGIDVEKIIAWRERVAKRVLSEPEYSALQTLNAFEKTEQFYSLWTLKESYSKAIGRGLTVPFNGFSIKKSRLNRLFETDDHYWLRQYDIDPDYKLSVCSTSRRFAERIALIGRDQNDDLTLQKMANYIINHALS